MSPARSAVLLPCTVARLFLGLALLALAPARGTAQELMTITLAGKTGSVGTVNGSAANARFEFPAGVAVDPAGNVYVVDTNASVIRKITPAGLVTTLAGSPGLLGSGDGTGSAARFAYPEAIATDAQGMVYVSDSFNATVRKITPGGVVTTLAGLAGVRGSVEGPGSVARFGHPRGLAVDLSGNIYVADAGNYTVRKITPAGVVSTFAGTAGQNGSGSFNLDGVGSGARFASPFGVAIDPAGSIIVTDAGWRTVRKISPSGVVTTLAGSVATGGVLLNGTGASAGFREPGAVAIDPAGNIYVLETNVHVVRRITASGVVTSLLGLYAFSGSADGRDNVVRFNLPSGIASDVAGNLYIADSLNFTIRKRLPVFVPEVTAQPQSALVNTGQNATFTVQARGTPEPTFQWRKNGIDLAGATDTTLTLTNIRAEDAGSYAVVASNIAGNTSSTAAILTVNSPPVFTAQPVNQTVNDSGTVELRAEVSSRTAASYQWLRNGVLVPGASTSTLAVRNASPGDAGNYTVVVSNAAGTVTSSVAVLTVLSSRFVNLSVRTTAGSGEATLIVGFAVAGDAKPLLIRGNGGVLTQYGVAGALVDPKLTVYRGATVFAENDDWSSSSDAALIASTALRVGAFAVPSPSRDAALLRTVAGGSYTTHVSAATGGPGIALTEVYDTNSTGAGRLVNLSARARVEPDDGTLIAGFVIAGNTRKRVLIRGAGPALATFGVEGVLLNPRLSVFQNGVVPIAVNDDWTADVAASAAAVGAFPFFPGSKDAAVILQLEPGAYTAQVAGVGEASGQALVEIYELP